MPISNGVKLGYNVKIHNYDQVNIYGPNTSLGDNCKVGSFVEIQRGVQIGDNSIISSNSFLCEGVRIGDWCFLGHGLMTINDRFPVPYNENWKPEGIEIGNNVSIGTSSTLMCGIRIGDKAVIGAHSLVLNDIPSGEVWAGVPARFIRKAE